MCLACLYLIGLRADRIHAGRMSAHERTVTEPGDKSRFAARFHATPGSVTVTVPARYAGKTAHQWHRIAYLYQRRNHQLKRTLMSSPTVSEAINIAATVYGNGSLLWQLARCESGLNPGAKNASGSSGLLQFMPGTFASTPYGRFSIWSPYANALAGGWMLAHGRRSEWVC